MTNPLKYRFAFLFFLTIVFSGSPFQKLFPQNNNKNKVRLIVDYVKIMNGDHYIDLKATSKIDKKSSNVSNIDILFYNEFDTELIELGRTKTNAEGKCRFVFKNFGSLKTDSTDTYTILMLFKGNESFKKTSKRLHFKDAEIKAELITKNESNYVKATLLNSTSKNPITDESLVVQVQRLFRPIGIGEEFNFTDETGSVLVPIEKGIPGIEGNLTIEVVLFESDDFGTVKDIIEAPIGVPFLEESTFNNRTMWSPRNKTPLFLLILPNLLIFGMWAIIIYLISNIFKILKS